MIRIKSRIFFWPTVVWPHPPHETIDDGFSVSKPTKLLAFARTTGRGAVQPEPERDDAAGSPPATGTRPAADPAVSTAEAKKNNRIATNLRLTRDQWRRVHELALDEETTVQELAIRGLSRLFQDRGLPRL
jgi:hypothetical protein